MKSINPNGLATSQNKKASSKSNQNAPTMSNQVINAQVPSVDGPSLGKAPSGTSMGIPNPSSPAVGNMAAMATAGIPTIATPNSGSSSSSAGSSSQSSGNLPDVSAPNYSDNLVNFIDDVLQGYTSPTVESPSTGIGTQEVQPTDNSAFEAIDAAIAANWTPPPPPPKMKVFHTFDNYADQDINVRTEGDIESVVTESKTAKDGLYSTDFAAKHYTVTFNRDFRDISVEPGDVTGGGRDDSGITVARIEKMGPRVFKVWFNRAKGANTYVNEFTVTGN